MRDFIQTTPVSASRVQQSFCRGLTTYHRAACVQAQIANDLADMLILHRGAHLVDRALEFGCGTGHLTRALTERVGIESLTLNDLVAECQTHAMARLPAGQKVRFQSGRVEALDAGDRFDLITSASVVQWIPDQRQLLQDLSARLVSGGWLALSGFGSGQFGELQALGSAASAPGYRNARDWQTILPDGLELVATQQRDIPMYFDTARAVLRHLRETGVNGNAQGGWTRAKLAAFEQAYVTRFGTDSGVPLTYDAVWVLARKV